jgi:ABC-type antimicrobial peptide transport system permease subunit
MTWLRTRQSEFESACLRRCVSMLYGVAPIDPWSFADTVVLMAVVGAAAAYIPARRASRVDPMTALHAD